MRLTRATALYQSFPMLVQHSAQIWSYAPQYHRPRHFHAEPELNLVVAGQARFGVGRHVVDVSAGQLIEFAAGQDHVLLQASADLVLFAIGLSANLMAQIERDGQGQAQLLTHVRPRTTEWSAIVQHCSALTESTAAPLVAELWQRVHAVAPQQGPRTPNCRTRRALALMAAAPELSREEVARATGANSSELSRSFHADLGMTLVEYRSRLRLLKFIQLVDEQPRNLLSAALGAGFGSYSQCHRAFCAALDCSPREFFTTAIRAQMEGAFAPVSCTA